ncbi:MAG: hypothetical protein SH850_27255 [Planctomycetaceae bacterium]|nr:hypothetical protein [Planctomycetaceae bacterium]
MSDSRLVSPNCPGNPPAATGWQRRVVAANHRLAPVMFTATVAFLLATHHALWATRTFDDLLQNLTTFRVLMALYLVFVMEACLYNWFELPGAPQYLWSALCPPLRLVRRDLRSGSLIWWPALGWTPADRHLARFVTTWATGLLWIGGLALLAVAAVLFLTGRSFGQILSSSVSEGLLALMWTIVVAEVCALTVTLPWARVWRLHRNNLLLLWSPLVPLLALAYVPRLVRGALAWNSLHHVGIRDPHQRLSVLEKQLEKCVAEVHDLQSQLHREEHALAGDRGSGC